MPSFGGNPESQDRLLGPMRPSQAQRGVPTREIEIFRKIRQHTERCARCRTVVAHAPASLKDHSRVVAVRECRSDLFAAYEKEVSQPIPDVFDEGPAWRAAYIAAVADAALQSRDPAALFAAGRYLERQRLIEYLLRELPKEAKVAMERALRQQEARERRRQERGGKTRLNRRLPHVELIYRALIYDETMADQGENWLNSAPKERTLRDVLALFREERICAELIAGNGTRGSRLPISHVEVDDAAKRLDITVATGERLVSFQTVANSIARMKKPRPYPVTKCPAFGESPAATVAAWLPTATTFSPKTKPHV